MPIKRILWDGNAGRDIHVLRGGVTRDLTHALKFVRDTDDKVFFADDYLVEVADVTLTFTPVFKRTLQGGEFVGDANGIRVSRATGFVSVSDVIPFNVKHNFLIEVEAKNDGNQKVFREAIRVHVHGSVTQVWLSPAQLTVRPISGPGEAFSSQYRFSVRAQFDDGLVGDLTDGHGVTWNEPAGHVDAASGRISILATDHPGDTFPVAATLPLGLGGASTPAGPRVRIESSLRTQATPPQITLVAGAGVPGIAAVEDSLNILLVADGFRLEDQNAFNTIVDGLVHHLTASQLTKPFDLLSNRKNFWKLFVPATERGLSIGSEVTTFGIHPFAATIPAARRPPDNPPAPEPPPQWNISHLLYAVGLPVHGDAAIARTPAALRLEWTRLLQTDPGPNLLSDDVIFQWKLMAKRSLVEDVDDGFPGLSLGAIPIASAPDTDILALHENRVGVAGRTLRKVVGTLGNATTTLADGRPIGLLWREEGTAVSATTNTTGYAIGARLITLAAAGTGNIRDGDTVTFAADPHTYLVETGLGVDVSAGGTIKLAAPGLLAAIPASAVPVTLAPFRHRNADCVVILTALRGGRPANTDAPPGRFLALACGSEEVFAVKAVPGKNAFALDLPAAPASVPSSVARTLAHELGHSLGLGDEYVDFAEPFPETAKLAFGNLQRESDAQIPNPADPTKRLLHGDQIQWIWHRITAAALVNGDITSGPGLDEARIPVDVPSRFAVGNVLRLRVRPPRRALKKFDQFEVSGDLIVNALEPDAVLVRFVHVISAQAFPRGSLLYRPKPAPASVLSPLYPYAEMVAKNVKDAITTNKKPLIDAPGDNKTVQTPIVGDNAATGRTAIVNLHIDAKYLPRIVGLYPGGGRFLSGIFHPTGHCMMRNNLDVQAEFCAVCRYVLTDLVAPDLHPKVDADYEPFYPQK
jgi:hypothetical protein